VKFFSLFLALLILSNELISVAHARPKPQPSKKSLEPPVVMEQIAVSPSATPAVSIGTEAQDPYGRAPASLTLEDSIQTAIQQSTLTLKSGNDVKFSGEQLLQGYTQFLPNLVLGGSYTYENGRAYLTQATPVTVQTRNYGPTYTVSTTLNLFNGLADINAYQSALNKKHAADFSLDRAKQVIALDIAQTYLQVVLDQDITEIARKNLASSQARERLLQAQTSVGARNLSDYFRQVAQTASDHLYLINSENKLHTDRLVLIQKLRLEETKNYVLAVPKLRTPQTAGAINLEEKSMIETALEHREDLKSSQSTVTASYHDVNVAAAPYFPRLDFEFSLTDGARHYDQLIVNGQNSLPASQPSISNQLGNQIYGVLALNLTWEIFSRGVTRESVALARKNADNFEIDAVDRQKQVVAEVRQALGDYRTALQQLDSTQTGLVAAQKAFEVVQGRYEVGASSFIDLITAQATLVQAESARAQASIGYELQIRSMETALGTTLASNYSKPNNLR
jgi:outer membrane protein